ncbi:hypothetical protein METH_08640 [Leisingera methylohalidivorans DSM 14336]|uniref:Uncharacterized protein n=1 Tax=Leisingera methylohalidivorans DSM 14336 TaxID=999552 RepID=V9W042_9RHOB|nr:hypothetical protein METH_08640 [Leisingera methylohalidivorans DSM 14336]
MHQWRRKFFRKLSKIAILQKEEKCRIDSKKTALALIIVNKRWINTFLVLCATQVMKKIGHIAGANIILSMMLTLDSFSNIGSIYAMFKPIVSKIKYCSHKVIGQMKRLKSLFF